MVKRISKKAINEAIPVGPVAVGQKPQPNQDSTESLPPNVANIVKDLRKMKKSLAFRDQKGNTIMVDKNPDGTFSTYFSQTRLQKLGDDRKSEEDVIQLMKNFASNRQIHLAFAESSDLVKKDLLRRKISEHFSANPKSKSIVIKSGIGGNTVWKVDRDGNDFKIIEVNTKREEYLLSEAPIGSMTPGSKMPIGGQKPAAGSQQFNVDQFAQMDLSQKIEMLRSKMIPLNSDSIAITFADFIKPGSGKDIVTLRDLVQQMASSVSPAAKAAVGSALGFLTNLSNQKRLMGAGKKTPGRKLKEAEEDFPKPEEADPEDNDSGIETTPEKETPQEEPQQDGPKTGEESQLISLVKNKPILGIDVYEDEDGSDNVELKLAGLENNLKITFPKPGGAKYNIGDEPSRVLKSVGTDGKN